jgi:xanthine dehydrogenase YagR molybdenum-binding subunit
MRPSPHWDDDGDLHLHISTQAIGRVAEQAAKRWGLKPGQVHVYAEHVGGGFGAKANLTADAIAAAELARAAGAPVRVALTRAVPLSRTPPTRSPSCKAPFSKP